MGTANIFDDDWRNCLKSHFSYTVKVGDTLTSESLSSLLQSAGISERTIAELRVTATMHVDDVGKDYQPDLNILDDNHVHEPAPPAAETTAPTAHEHHEAHDEGKPEADSDDFGQLSMF